MPDNGRSVKREKGTTKRWVKRTNRIFWYIIVKDLIIIAVIREVIINYTSGNLLSSLHMLVIILQSRNCLHSPMRKPGLREVN